MDLETQHQMDQAASAASRFVASLQETIVTSLEAAAEGVSQQTRIASVMQKLQAKEAILEWLIERRRIIENRLEQAALPAPTEAMLRRQMLVLDHETEALLTSSGMATKEAKTAVKNWKAITVEAKTPPAAALEHETKHTPKRHKKRARKKPRNKARTSG